jgi:hypothetical protein
MGLSSTIRVRQINSGELNNFVSQAVLQTLSITGLSIGGNIIPTSSGIYSLGNTGLYFNNLYANQVNLPSGSGISFGPNTFTAYTSGGGAVFKVNNYTLTSSAQGLSIIGPQGNSGLQGLVGPTGGSGIGITGYSSTNNKLTFFYSNGTSGAPINLPSGAVGQLALMLLAS